MSSEIISGPRAVFLGIFCDGEKKEQLRWVGFADRCPTVEASSDSYGQRVVIDIGCLWRSDGDNEDVWIHNACEILNRHRERSDCSCPLSHVTGPDLRRLWVIGI